MTKEPTDRQIEVLKALKNLLARGARPTFRNIADEAECCQTYAYQAILSLERKGLITRIPKKHGAVGVVEGS